jgi:hypothetical protein
MTTQHRTSIRISIPRQNKLSSLREAWGFKSNDETIGFLIDIGNAEAMAEHASRHLANVRLKKAKIEKEDAEIKTIVAGLSPEMKAKLLSGEGL